MKLLTRSFKDAFFVLLNSILTWLTHYYFLPGWAGRPGNQGNATMPSETGRSQEDIQSTILIFTR